MEKTELKNFKNSMLLQVWNDFNIPTDYYNSLPLEQMTLMKQLLFSATCADENKPISQKNEMFFRLKSEKKYKLFLTLPQELRKQLTFLSTSEKEKQKEFFNINNPQMNHKNLILVKNKKTIFIDFITYPNTEQDVDFFGYEKKPMLPEEKENKEVVYINNNYKKI